MHSPFTVLAAAALLAPAIAAAQPLRPQVDAWRKQHERRILDEAFALLAIPNVASNQDDIAKNVAFLTQAFAKRGVALTPLRAPTGGSPALFGEIKTPGATRTVVFYAHYDGQPVAGGGWESDPFAPKLSRYRHSAPPDDVPLPAPGDTIDPEVRIRARSASDDKGPIVAMLAALDAMTALNTVMQAQERFRSNRAVYASSLTNGAAGDPPGLGLSTTSPSGYYTLDLAPVGDPLGYTRGFAVIAIPAAGSSQSKDGPCARLKVEVLGGNIKYLSAGGAGDFSEDAGRRCWSR